MPNGGDRNFIRLCAAIDGYRLRYGAWPTSVRLSLSAIEDLRDHVLGKAAFEKAEIRIRFISDYASMIAEGPEGRSYNYGKEGFPNRILDISAKEWLGISPLPECY
jgi:hypothetical protein